MPWMGKCLGFKVRKILPLLLLVVLFVLPAVSSTLKDEQHRATLTIIVAFDGKRAGCSATAIAPHVVLTAQHCDIDGGTLYFNQDTPPYQRGQTVTEKYFDKNDHMLMVVPGVEFKHFVRYDAGKIRSARQGEYVYLWGNPALLMDQYREGYATGTVNFRVNGDVNAEGPFTMLAVPIVGGDSGSAVFSGVDGQLVGITTWGIAGGKFLGSYPLQFTQSQIDQAVGQGNFVYLPEPIKSAAKAPPKVFVNIDTTRVEKLMAIFVGLFAIPMSVKALSSLVKLFRLAVRKATVCIKGIASIWRSFRKKKRNGRK